MPKPRATRPYDSHSRHAAAHATRQFILAAARQLFLTHGYAATTMSAIAHQSRVALDTVYAAVGKKPALFRLLLETALSGTDSVIPAEQRDYVRAIRAEKNAAQKLRLYAAALRHIQPRLAPLIRVLQSAAELDAGLHNIWQSIARRRARNMRLFAQDLAATGSLRQDLSIAKAADIIWTMNSPEFYVLLVEQRGWSLSQFESWLAASWIQLLLQPASRSSKIKKPIRMNKTGSVAPESL